MNAGGQPTSAPLRLLERSGVIISAPSRYPTMESLIDIDLA